MEEKGLINMALNPSRSIERMDQSMKSGRGGARSEVSGSRADGDDLPDELTPEQRKAIIEKIKKLKLDGRLLPDSAMTTYFGKPAFHSYGNGNTRPASGGLIYG